MIIVIEGADGAGKTTLAHALMEAIPNGLGEYIHATRPDDQWSYAAGLIDQAVASHRRGKVVVMDRLWISDNVYSWIHQHPSRSGINVRRQESVLNRYGAFYVMCTPHPRQLINEFRALSRNRDEMYAGKIEGMQLVMQRYYDLWHGGAVPQGYGDRPEQYTDQLSVLSPMNKRPLTFLYDRFTVAPPSNWKHTLYEFIEMNVAPFLKADVASTFTRGDEWMNLTGSLLTCKALLVAGHEVGYMRPMWWPMFDREGDAYFLTQSLHRAGIPELDVAVMHAYTRHNMSISPLAKAVDWLQTHRPDVKIVALGPDATIALEELGVNYTMIPTLGKRVPNFHSLLNQVIYGNKRTQSGAGNVLLHPSTALEGRAGVPAERS